MSKEINMNFNSFNDLLNHLQTNLDKEYPSQSQAINADYEMRFCPDTYRNTLKIAKTGTYTNDYIKKVNLNLDKLETKTEELVSVNTYENALSGECIDIGAVLAGYPLQYITQQTEINQERKALNIIINIANLQDVRAEQIENRGAVIARLVSLLAIKGKQVNVYICAYSIRNAKKGGEIMKFFVPLEPENYQSIIFMLCCPSAWRRLVFHTREIAINKYNANNYSYAQDLPFESKCNTEEVSKFFKTAIPSGEVIIFDRIKDNEYMSLERSISAVKETLSKVNH